MTWPIISTAAAEAVRRGRNIPYAPLFVILPNVEPDRRQGIDESRIGKNRT
jgi:hypothetical protein